MIRFQPNFVLPVVFISILLLKYRLKAYTSCVFSTSQTSPSYYLKCIERRKQYTGKDTNELNFQS